MAPIVMALLSSMVSSKGGGGGASKAAAAEQARQQQILQDRSLFQQQIANMNNILFKEQQPKPPNTRMPSFNQKPDGGIMSKELTSGEAPVEQKAVNTLGNVEGADEGTGEGGNVFSAPPIKQQSDLSILFGGKNSLFSSDLYKTFLNQIVGNNTSFGFK